MVAFNDLINTLKHTFQKNKELFLPKVTKRGTKREILDINEKRILFKNKENTKTINIGNMQICYDSLMENITKGNEIARKYFTDCRFTFFLQFLVYFDLIEYSGEGVKGSQLRITKIKK